MAEPIRPLSNEIPRRNPSADNAIGTEGGDIGGNRGTNSRTRGLRLEGKAKRGARFVRSAKTEQISTRWKRRSRIDFVVNWKSSCGFFFWRKVVVVVVVLYVKLWSVFLEYLILFFFFLFLLFLFAICFCRKSMENWKSAEGNWKFLVAGFSFETCVYFELIDYYLFDRFFKISDFSDYLSTFLIILVFNNIGSSS